MKPCFSAFSTRSDTNVAVQPQKTASGLKFRIEKVEGMFFLCSENKGTDLRLCFHICKKNRFSHDAANIINILLS